MDKIFDKLLITCGQLRQWKNSVNSVDNSNPLSTKTTYPTNAPMYPGETHYQNNGNLLRIAPSGKFRSLYPYKRK